MLVWGSSWRIGARSVSYSGLVLLGGASEKRKVFLNNEDNILGAQFSKIYNDPDN